MGNKKQKKGHMKNGIFLQIKIDKMWAAMWHKHYRALWNRKIWFCCIAIVVAATIAAAAVVVVACVGLMFALSLQYIKVIT